MDTTLLSGGTDATARWTRADLDRFPDDGHRRELVDGHLLVSPLARRRHQAVVGRIAYALESWVRAGGGGAVYPGVNVDLADDTHLEPDVVWTSDTDLERDEVEVHRSLDEPPVVLRRGDTLTCEVLQGLAAAVVDLLGPPA